MKAERAGAAEQVYPDTMLVVLTALLCAFGMVMVYSSSALFAERATGNPLSYAGRQAAYLVVGLLGLLLVYRLGYQRLVRWCYPALLAVLLLLVVVLIPGLGTRAGGSQRWLRLGVIGLQPGELVKVVFVLYLAASLTRKKARIRAFGQGFLPHLVVCGLLVLLLLMQPDFGTAAVLTMLLFFMLFVAGTRLRYILVAALAALPMAYGLVAGSAYRMRRLLAFLDPWSRRYDIGYQISESLMGFGSGGVTGAGLGAGKHKLFFLPAAHTDFIFSIIGEELGLLGALAVLLLFGLLVWRGVRAAWRAPDLFGTYLAFGLTVLIGLQALVNMGVVTGLLPTKGLTLPFFSYGGSSLVCNLLAMGIILSVSKEAQAASRPPPAKVTWP